MKVDLVCVKWVDHQGDDDHWVAIKELVKFELAEIISGGFRVFEDKKKLILAASVGGAFVGGLLILDKTLIKDVVLTGFSVEIPDEIIACEVCSSLGLNTVPALKCPAVKKLERVSGNEEV